MMGMIWVVIFVALTGTHIGYGLPVRPTPGTYPHDPTTLHEGWGSEAYAAVPALALVLTAVGLLFGCTWCYRHKDCKPNEGADNQLFAASVTHLHDNRRANPPDSGFSEPANNNISEDNNNGPISLREMQNIANNNATAYIISENEERNRDSRESVVEFEPLPSGIRVLDPLEHCADWFGGEDFTRNRLQYLREIGRGWFGRVVEGEIESEGTTSTVAVKILNQNASLEDKARFLDEARVYRDVSHENVLCFIAKCLQEDPWILIFELCSTDLQQYLVVNRPKMAILNEGGVPLRLICDVTAGLTHLHARGIVYGNVWSGAVLVRGSAETARAVLGQYTSSDAPQELAAPELRRPGAVQTAGSDVFGLGVVMWEVCAWGAAPPQLPPPPPDLPCPYRNHLYQVMQLCWAPGPARPAAGEVLALVRHLLSAQGGADQDFEERWQRLKPNTIPKVDEHVAIVHAPSTSIASHFTPEHDLEPRDTLSVDMDTAVSRSSSIMSDKDPLSVQIKSESLNNLHGSLDDVRNIYLTHNEMAVLECHQGNISLEEAREKEQDHSDSSVDPWLKDIMAGSQDDVSYYRDVSDVIKNLDNILNSEKTSSSESSHQASPSRDNLSLDCKKDYPMSTSMVKSPGISNFQNILGTGSNSKFGENEHDAGDEEDGDGDTMGTLSHSFERHSDTISQHTLENLTPDTPIKDLDICTIASVPESATKDLEDEVFDKLVHLDNELPKEIAVAVSDSEVPKLKELCVTSISSVSESIEQLNVRKDCQTSCDNNLTKVRTDIKNESKSIDDIGKPNDDAILTEIVNYCVANLDQVPLPIEEVILPERIKESPTSSESDVLLGDSKSNIQENQKLEGKRSKDVTDFVVESIENESLENLNKSSTNDLIEPRYDSSNHQEHEDIRKKENITTYDRLIDKNGVTELSLEMSPDLVQNKNNSEISQETNNILDNFDKSVNDLVCDDYMPVLPPDTVQIMNESTTPYSNTHENGMRQVNASDKVEATNELSNIESKIEEIITNTEKDLPVAASRTLIIKEPGNKELKMVGMSDNKDNLLVASIDKVPSIVEVKSIDQILEKQVKNEELVEHSSEVVDTNEGINMKEVDTNNKKSIGENLDQSFHRLDIVNENAQASKDIILTESVNKDVENKKEEKQYNTNNEVSNKKSNMEEIITNAAKDLPLSVNKTMAIKNTGNDEVKYVELSDIKQNSIEASRTIESKEPTIFAVRNIFENLEEQVKNLELMEGSSEVADTNEKINMKEVETSAKNFARKIPDHGIHKVQAVNENALILAEGVCKEMFLQEPDVTEEANYKEMCTELSFLTETVNEKIPIDIPHENKVSTEIDKQENEIEKVCILESEIVAIPKEDDIKLAHSNIAVDIDNINVDAKLHEADYKAIDSIELKRNKAGDAVAISNKELTQIENNTIRSENDLTETKNLSDEVTDSTVYMDLMNDTNSEIVNLGKEDAPLNNDIKKAIRSSLETVSDDIECSLVKNDSTVYLDLPSSMIMIQETGNFLQMERSAITNHSSEIVCSTPKVSDSSNVNETLEKSFRHDETQELSKTKVPEETAKEETLTKVETKYVQDNLSPFDSPTKSHHTDTYDENSSVVLGPFEQCSLELYRGSKHCADLVELPKEELLAFSSNFSEINLETPSPLRDGNFLNEVPDIVHDDLQFDDIGTVSVSEPAQSDPSDNVSDDTEDQSATEKHVSPSTPPNSPGIFLASTSQQKYLVDIDMDPPVQPIPESDNLLQKDIELNQIELQITSKLAMAENENNLNIEYSGPLTVEGLVEDNVMLRDSDVIPESYLAGNGGSAEDLREGLTLDEECVKALRNELELKLPLAQVAAIEPQCEAEWGGELPPPPELVVSYPAALSPIAEETRQQLSAYENDTNWNPPTRTDSSESYPEPCNNSTDEVTDLPTAAHSARENTTFTTQSPQGSPYKGSPQTHSPHNTYTIHKDIASSKEITMSADSLNASPYKKPRNENDSPIDDRTYNKNDDEKLSNCERISQISPFLLSPTTDTSVPESSDNFDNATGVSTLSKTTLPTDAKHLKPSETQCLSKATSIDSWCSNDTLYNVEENFEDLAMDPDGLIDFEPKEEHEKEEASDSTDTLTHPEDEKELSHCSTYIVHDSKSEVCETFSPDSITENENYTYTKAKTDAVATTPSGITKSDTNDSTKNSQTKDLAYGTLMSGVSFSNCTTEVASAVDDVWKMQQPELIRKSPIPNDINITPAAFSESKECIENLSPQLTSEPCVKKMDSVEMSCLQDNSMEGKTFHNDTIELTVVIENSPENNYKKNMAPSVTSTPLTELVADSDNVEAISMILPENKTDSSYAVAVANFLSFQQSAEVRPQDLSSDVSNGCANQDTEGLLEGDTKLLSTISNREGTIALERTPTYSDFENSATTKPQEKSVQSVESGVSSEDFCQFASSVRDRPQDLSSLIDASCLLLKSERLSSELAMASTNTNDHTNIGLSPPNISNLIESHISNVRSSADDMFLMNFDEEEGTEQPHSIIITESAMDAFKESPNKTYDSHTEGKLIDLNFTYDSHAGSVPKSSQSFKLNSIEEVHQKINGVAKPDISIDINETKSPTVETTNEYTDLPRTSTEDHTGVEMEKPNGISEDRTESEINCNGGSEKFATVHFLNETFEELIESNVDDTETKDSKETEGENLQDKTCDVNDTNTSEKPLTSPNDEVSVNKVIAGENCAVINGSSDIEDIKVTAATEDFLQNEKKFCQLDSYHPLLSDIRFTGPASEILSTSFTQESPTEPTSPECEQDSKPNTAADILKEWDSDSDSHSSNSSSGEFIWKGGDGHETSVVPSTRFEHQRGTGPSGGGSEGGEAAQREGSEGSGSSGSGSEGDEVEFVPSSWDCRAEPSKSSLRSLEAQPDSKKRVVFKRQKYHCVYEYPREVAEIDPHSPYLPDLSTYSDWEPSNAEEAELGYGQLFGPSPLDLYPLRAGIAFGPDYDEDFFISSSARPFESLGIMSTSSQFFPGMHVKRSPLDRDLPDEAPDEFPPPPSPLPSTTLVTRTPSLDFTTPDSGVEDITPGSTTDEDFKAKKLPEAELAWRPVDSASSSESVSPSSPGGEALGELRHTRDKLKLDLPPSPHIPPSPRHNRVFNFVLDKPKRRSTDERPVELGSTPLVMTDETPVVTTALPLLKEDELPVPEPTFSTFGKSVQKVETEQKIVLTADAEEEAKVESPKVVEAVKGEGTVLDSGDEDSGIESSSKATLERNKTPNVS